MAKISEKYNDSCLKIFDLLLLLSEGNAKFDDVIKIFADSKGNVTQNSNVLLNKYLNTLKVFGVDVVKSKNKYYLHHMPFSFNLREDDLYAISLINSALSYLPKGKNKSNIDKFLADLTNRYDDDTKKLSTVINVNKNFDLSFYFKKFEKQIEECEQYCADASKLELAYDMDGKHHIIICVPQEIKYLENFVTLSVYNNLSRQIIDIPFSSIKNIRKISEHSSVNKTCMTVVFKLKSPLAERYKLRDWERLDNKDSQGTITIINSGEDLNTLASRLLRYDNKCVVISPKEFKDKMREIIDEALNNY